VPITFTGVYHDSGATQGGHHDTSLAHTASTARSGRAQMRRGGRRLNLTWRAAVNRLVPGTYMLRMTAVNASGRSNTVEVKFWVIGKRP
jgi:hypothetical protein